MYKEFPGEYDEKTFVLFSIYLGGKDLLGSKQ